LTAKRQICGQFINNDTDEQMVATVMPILMNALAHSQAKRMEKMIVDKLETDTVHGTTGGVDEGSGGTITRLDLLAGRTDLGSIGVDPDSLVYILSVAAYNELLSEGQFDEFSQIDSAAAKVTGTIANFYGSPVVISDQFDTDGDALVVNRNSFVIPRLGGVNVETDYEVANQRTAIVSSQTVGFDQIIAGVGASLVRPA
jgi:hypothetical protein